MIGLVELVGADRRRLTELLMKLTIGGQSIAAAESLTGGLLTAVLTEIPGSSAVVRGSIVCYATDIKRDLVGVDAALLATAGAVDPEVAAQLARGARERCTATVGIGLTGVAGPEPQDGKPVGTVYVALAEHGGTTVSGPTSDWSRGSDDSDDRARIRFAAVRIALDMLAEYADRLHPAR